MKPEEMPDKKFLARVHRVVGRAINNYSLIEEGDRIAVGLSGGKDSMVLLDILAYRRKRVPVKHDLLAIHVDIENIDYENDIEYMEWFCEKLEVPFHLIRSSVDLERGREKSKCFICSWQRRKELFNFIRRENCSKLAMGHHRDDVNETLIMNLIFNGTFSAMPPKLSMFKGEVETIRPLILLSEYATTRYARIKEFPGEIRRCPHGDVTKRNEVKELIEQMEKLNKNARNNIFSSMSHIHREYLTKKK